MAQEDLSIYTHIIYSVFSAGGREVEEQDDMFILIAPQNAVGNCIIGVRNLRINCDFVPERTFPQILN